MTDIDALTIVLENSIVTFGGVVQTDLGIEAAAAKVRVMSQVRLAMPQAPV